MNNRVINFVDLKQQYADIDFSSIQDNFKCGSFVGGNDLTIFEDSLCGYLEVDHCTGVGSGTDALILALKALDISQGDEVIVPANTFIATALAVTHVGAKVIFADVSPLTYNIDVSKLDHLINVNTKAIICVHLYGKVCDMVPLSVITSKYNLFLIEDCAQAFGARDAFENRVGTEGDVGCFSFYPAKNLGTCGQGGAVVSSDKKIIDKVISLANLGRDKNDRYLHTSVGYNSRLDSISAAFLTKCLPHVDTWNNKRVDVAHIYDSLLRGSWVQTQKYTMDEHVYHLYEVDCGDLATRSGLKDYLEARGIMCGLHYPIPCHKQPVYKEYNDLTLQVSESLADSLLSLPMHPNLTMGDQEIICDLIKDYGV